jgi:DNA-binding transcriptional regulator GbsR (MarR family)
MARGPEKPASLTPAQDRFIAAWGQMGSTWGISRTMAEVHALLFIVGQPLCTDDVMERLAISRGNASMSLRALVDWGIVSREHKRGDRKEYFVAEQEPWAIIKSVVQERFRREIHPVLAVLAEIRDTTEPSLTGADRADVGEHNKRLDSMIDVLQTIDQVGEKFLDLPAEELRLTASQLKEGRP